MKQKRLAIIIFAALAATYANADTLSFNAPQSQVSAQPSDSQPPLNVSSFDIAANNDAPSDAPAVNQIQGTSADGTKETTVVDVNGNLKMIEKTPKSSTQPSTGTQQLQAPGSGGQTPMMTPPPQSGESSSATPGLPASQSNQGQPMTPSPPPSSGKTTMPGGVTPGMPTGGGTPGMPTPSGNQMSPSMPPSNQGMKGSMPSSPGGMNLPSGAQSAPSSPPVNQMPAPSVTTAPATGSSGPDVKTPSY